MKEGEREEERGEKEEVKERSGENKEVEVIGDKRRRETSTTRGQTRSTRYSSQ